MKVLATIATAALLLATPNADDFSRIEIEGNVITFSSNAAQIPVIFSEYRYELRTAEAYNVIETENGYQGYMIKDIGRGVSFELVPTGKFRENTEVSIDGKYYIMDEKNINGEPVRYDINHDSEFNIADLVMIQRYILGASPLTLFQSYRADINGDGRVDTFDIVSFRRAILERE